MPAIQLKGISGQAAEVTLGQTFDSSPFVSPGRRLRFSFWPCLRQFGSRCLFGARVMPLTLSCVVRENERGNQAMLRKERVRWIPRARQAQGLDIEPPAVRFKAALKDAAV